MSAYADGYRDGLEIAARDLDRVASYIRALPAPKAAREETIARVKNIYHSVLENLPDALCEPNNIICNIFDNGNAGDRVIDTLEAAGFKIVATKLSSAAHTVMPASEKSDQLWKLRNAAQAQYALIQRMQVIVADYRPSQTWNAKNSCLLRLRALLDGPEQREAQRLVEVALGTNERKEI